MVDYLKLRSHAQYFFHTGDAVQYTLTTVITNRKTVFTRLSEQFLLAGLFVDQVTQSLVDLNKFVNTFTSAIALMITLLTGYCGRDRANLRFADVENSGRADLIWLDKYTGAGRVWKNNGYVGPNGGGGGSSFSWSIRGVLYSPIDRGECMVSSGRVG